MIVRNLKGLTIAAIEVDPQAPDGEIFRALQAKGILAGRSLSAITIGADGVWDDRTGNQLLVFDNVNESA